MTFDNTDIDSLTAKLVLVDLTDAEREALCTIVARGLDASGSEPDDRDADVTGFVYEAITLERGAVDFRPLLSGINAPSVWKAPANRPGAFLPTGETVQ